MTATRSEPGAERILVPPQARAGTTVAGGTLERIFKLSAWGTTAGTEALAGLTTFMVMACIIFVNPTILATTLPDAGLRPRRQ